MPSSRYTPKNTGYEHDLYALSRPFVAGMERQAVETQFLRHVDNLAAIARQKLVRGGLKALSPSERIDWVRFLMSLRLRQRDIVQELLRTAEHELRNSLRDSPEEYKAVATNDDPLSFEEWTEQRFPGLIENYGLSLFSGFVDHPTIGNKILHMRWWLWDFAGVSKELLLSDNPCIFTHGIDDSKLVIALPVSPTKAFFATRSDRAAHALRAQTARELLIRLNVSSNQARVRIYARDSSPKRFIRNRLRGRQAH